MDWRGFRPETPPKAVEVRDDDGQWHRGLLQGWGRRQGRNQALVKFVNTTGATVSKWFETYRLRRRE